ncbi:MAG: ABC-F family ATP-binding cassette domain-containing protein [Monoglobus pectinilyticus]|uniref:ABC-F family ATP-binding cassette domain-containing protein n=1 Tax=Monoglobus pectinilyticus TaxID=1981510 RepID=UPI00300E7C42
MLISISNLSKSFGENQILKDINLTIEDNCRYGLIGVNGAGKSTLLSIIMGELDYDDGDIYKSPNLTIGYLKQNSGLDRNSTIISEMRNAFSDIIKIEDELRLIEEKMLSYSEHNSSEYKSLMSEYSKKQSYFESMDGYNIDVKIKTVLNGLGFSDRSLETEINVLSGGEKTRLALAALLLEEPNLLILDEPTNHLDFKTLDWLENYLINSYKGSLLIVSHDRYFLDNTVENMLEIERGKMYSYNGNYSKYLVLKEERNEVLRKEYEAQQLQISQMQTYIDKNITRASTSGSAKSRVKALERMELIEKPDDDIKPIKLKFETIKEPYKDVLTVENLDITVGDRESAGGIKNICSGLNLSIKRGDKVALIGDNGIGKSSFLKVIQDIIPHQNGSVVWGKNTSVSYYEQENLNLNPNNLAINELWDRFPRIPEAQIRRVLGNVRLTKEDVYKPVKVISGGERAKLAFCIIMLEKSNVILFDEPTNHLDLPSKEILEQAMNEYDGTLLFVSHDRYLLNKVPNKIIEMTKDGFTIYDGNFEYYKQRKEWIKQKQSIETNNKVETNNSSQKSSGGYRSKEQRKAETKRKLQIAELEKMISKTEEEISALENEMTKEEVFSDYILMNEKNSELEKLNSNLEEYYDNWTKLSEEQE